jgi:hypothetical protein
MLGGALFHLLPEAVEQLGLGPRLPPAPCGSRGGSLRPARRRVAPAAARRLRKDSCIGGWRNPAPRRPDPAGRRGHIDLAVPRRTARWSPRSARPSPRPAIRRHPHRSPRAASEPSEPVAPVRFEMGWDAGDGFQAVAREKAIHRLEDPEHLHGGPVAFREQPCHAQSRRGPGPAIRRREHVGFRRNALFRITGFRRGSARSGPPSGLRARPSRTAGSPTGPAPTGRRPAPAPPRPPAAAAAPVSARDPPGR